MDVHPIDSIPDNSEILIKNNFSLTSHEQEFDNIVRLAAGFCGTEYAWISLFNADYQWYKASIGIKQTHSPLHEGLASIILNNPVAVQISDAGSDVRLFDSPMIHSRPFFQWCAAIPLLLPGEDPRGMLCVADVNIHPLSECQMDGLCILAQQAASLIAQREKHVPSNATPSSSVSLLHNSSMTGNAPLQSVMAASPFAMYALDPDARITMWNVASEKLFGWSVQEVIGRRLPIVAPDQEEEFKALLGFVMSGETITSLEISRYHRDGQLLELNLSVAPLRSDDGTVYGVVAIAMDVSLHKRAEEQSETISAMSQIFLTAESLTAIYRSVPRILAQHFAYPIAALELYDDKSGEMIFVGSHGLEPTEVSNLRVPLDQTLSGIVQKSGKALYDNHAGNNPLRRSPELRDLNIETFLCQPLILGSKVIGTLCLADSTKREIFPGTCETLEMIGGLLAQAIARKRIEEEQQETSQTLRALVQSSPLAIISLDQDARILTWNTEAEHIFGWAEDETVGKSVNSLPGWLPPDISVDELIGEEKALRNHEIHSRHKDGSSVHISLSTSLLYDSKQAVSGVIVMAADVSDRREARDQTHRQLERMAATRTVDMAISASLDLRVTLEIVIQQIVTQLHIDAADVLLYDQGSQMLEYAAGTGFHTGEMRRRRLRLGSGYAGQAVFNRKMVHIHRLSHEESLLHDTKIPDEELFVSYLAVPLIAKGEVKGVLEIFERTTSGEEPEWMDFLGTLVGQAAIAIDNASLFDRLQRTNMELRIAYDATIEGWSRALELRDRETEGHSERVTEMTMRLARRIGIREDQMMHLRRGALLHDIGKMGIPDSILLKPGILNDQEWSIMRKHPVYAHQLLSPIEFLRPALIIPYCHHEKWDGSGYPRGIKGEEIPLVARAFTIVDIYDALTSERPYRKAWTRDMTITHIKSLTGNQLDPDITAIFLEEEL